MEQLQRCFKQPQRDKENDKRRRQTTRDFKETQNSNKDMPNNYIATTKRCK